MFQRLGHGPGLALVCECWSKNEVYDFALCLHWDMRMF